VPNYNSFSNYAKRIVYRAGVKYDKTDDGDQNLLMTLDHIRLGLPITGTSSNVNFILKCAQPHWF
jgi:hypothetical protein